MSRIDIGEIRDFAFQLRAANQTGRKIIQGIKTTVTNYIEDGSLKGKAVESSKNYYQMTYIPLCDTITEAMNESEERLKRYIQDFHDQVDPSPNAKIDADGLYELGQMIERIESKKEALYQRMNSSTEGQMQTYRSQLATAYKQENILEKYLAFEQSHGAFFDHLTDLVQGIQQTVRELQSNIQFNSQTGGYDLSKLNFTTVNRMRKTLGKASAIDTTIYDFAAYSKVKQGGMWILSKDGKVDIKATEAYNTASFNGELPKENNQATEEGELLKATLESLKQNKDPITGHEISKAQSFGILTSLVFGYTTKKYRGKKLTIQRSTLSNMNRTIKSKSIITSEIEEKILWGQRKNLNKNEIIGGHSSNINNRHSNYAVEIVKINPDGTKEVRFTTQFPDGNLAKIKKSTIFPDDWSDNQILDRVKNIGDSSPIRVRERDGASLHRAIIEGVEIDVIKLGDNIISGYPTGQVNAPFPGGFTK
ncbi:EndoU domain-containing protein [Listeria monocytogenes]|nr:transposase [Listeria monocytogenes]EAD1190854.1 transposase [Listeria monocytogenes]EAG4303739.1 transposase [Listeria monocytogenes]EAW7083229.1 transposase [Listeria monocytogenes]EAW7089124.1 transposase [Listeria monocytogenes]